MKTNKIYRTSIKLVREEGKEYIIQTPNNVEELAKDFLENEAQEVLLLIGLNVKNKVCDVFEVTRGCIDKSLCSPFEIFKRLLLSNCTRFVLAHNHPSGDENPSDADVFVAKKIKEASKLLEIEMLDFIIIGDRTFSFAEACLI